MADYTSKVVSGNTTTYTITDTTGASATVAVTQNSTVGNTIVYAGAAVHGDAVNQMAQLSLLLATGLVP
jgi:hypothetical protein